MSSAPVARLDIYDAQSAMLTKDQLANLLGSVNVEDVATEAGVSTKTIYRLRHKAANPTLGTIEKIVGAVKRVKRKPAKAAA